MYAINILARISSSCRSFSNKTPFDHSTWTQTRPDNHICVISLPEVGNNIMPMRYIRTREPLLHRC